MALICDTGPLFAAMDRNDVDHTTCAALLSEATEQLVVPSPVIVELDWLASRRLGVEAFDAFLLSVENATVTVHDLSVNDYARVRELCLDYADLGLRFVDAAVMTTAERMGEPKIATLDKRHFGVVRPSHVRRLDLLPR